MWGSFSMSILVNGSPTNDFIVQKELHQRDPLAPFIFLVVAKGLSDLIREAESKNFLSGVEVGNNNLRIALQFADDTIFFLEKCFDIEGYP